RFCRRCGRALSGAERVVEAPPSSLGHERSWKGVGSMLAFCAILLGGSVAGMIAIRWASAPAAHVDLALTLFFAIVVAVYAFKHRELVTPLLGRLDLAWRTVANVLICGLALGVFATAYFALVRRLDVEEVSYMEAYRASGWPVWSAFALVSIAPALTEEV